MATDNVAINETSTPPAAPSRQSLLYREAFEHALPATAAISEEELLPVNIDVPSAIATALGALPQIMSFREEAAKLHRFDVSHFDQLQLHTFAVGHAHAMFLAASAPPEAIAALNERGVKLRDTMYLDAVALAHRGLISGDRISEFKANVGYKNLAFDLLGLATLLRENWDRIATRTGVQLSELDEAELLGQQLMDAVGAREQTSGRVAQVQAQRQRNFTLFSRSYDQVRRAIGFLRWDDEDAEQICPSLFAGRGGSRRKETAAPTTPEPNTATAPVGNAPAATHEPRGASSEAGKSPSTSPAAIPGGDPFMTT
ncbi:MAG TPA: hypothetical protein VER96_01875 [Polyangiaceae bacterium]|nr:hypothetical protein [Polyangiaceae bacterium]